MTFTVEEGAALFTLGVAVVVALIAWKTLTRANQWRQRECWSRALGGLNELWKELGNDESMSNQFSGYNDKLTGKMEWWLWRFLLILEDAWLISAVANKKTSSHWQAYVIYNIRKPVILRIIREQDGAHFHPDFSKLIQKISAEEATKQRSNEATHSNSPGCTLILQGYGPTQMAGQRTQQRTME